MSFPYYYPYFSARQVAPNFNSVLESELSALRRSQLIQQQNEIQRDVLQKQQLINYYRIRQYEEQLRSKQRLDDVLDHDRIESQLIASKWRQIAYQKELNQIKHEQYIRQIDKLNGQRNYLQRDDFFNLKKNQVGESKRKQIENERAVQQYQQELLKKIQTVPNEGKNNKSMIEYQNNKNHYSLNEHKDEQDITKNIIINKKSLIDNDQNRVTFANPAISNRINKQNKQTQKQSYISNNYQTLEAKKQKTKDHDIDFSSISKNQRENNLTQIKKMNKYKKSVKEPKYKRKNSIHKHKTARNASTSNRTFNKSVQNDVSNNAIKKIQNRLKLSMLIFKDSKCKNNRHQIEHLLNTYEAQIRTRKQIKDKINNHPKILKRHSLVVQSR